MEQKEISTLYFIVFFQIFFYPILILDDIFNIIKNGIKKLLSKKK
jgi:hypothetical protein